MAHASGEIPVRCADTFHRGVHPPESIDRPAETSCATCVFGHLHPSVHENLPDRFLTPAGALEVMNYFWSRGHPEGINNHALATEHSGKFKKIAGLASG